MHFGKCTKEQVAAWKKIDFTPFNNAIPMTGVRLDFHTDSDYVKILLGIDGKYEIKIDGVLTEQYLWQIRYILTTWAFRHTH